MEREAAILVYAVLGLLLSFGLVAIQVRGAVDPTSPSMTKSEVVRSMQIWLMIVGIGIIIAAISRLLLGAPGIAQVFIGVMVSVLLGFIVPSKWNGGNR